MVATDVFQSLLTSLTQHSWFFLSQDSPIQIRLTRDKELNDSLFQLFQISFSK